MRLYKTANGKFAGTQADAKADGGKGWKPLEVPTDKYGLIGFLNNLVHGNAPDDTIISESLPQTAQEQQDEVLERLQPGDIITGQRGGPPGHRIAERAVLMGTSEEIAMLTDRIGEPDGQALGQIALAVASRLKELTERYKTMVLAT